MSTQFDSRIVCCEARIRLFLSNARFGLQTNASQRVTLPDQFDAADAILPALERKPVFIRQKTPDFRARKFRRGQIQRIRDIFSFGLHFPDRHSYFATSGEI
jgi:hypothetical protein